MVQARHLSRSPAQILTYAHVCSRMETYGTGETSEPIAGPWVSEFDDGVLDGVRLVSPILTYAHVCSRMLTYAHVCSRQDTLGAGCRSN
jgi:hypothetical protein